MGYRFTIGRDRRENFNQAAQEFRDAFCDEIQFLDRRYLVDRASIPTTAQMLWDATGKHQTAFIKFRPHLNLFERIGFDKAWQDYCKGGSNIHHFAEEYPPDELHREKQYSQKALRRIYRLLTFANPQ